MMPIPEAVALYTQGIPVGLMHPGQVQLYLQIMRRPEPTWVIECGRGWGKTSIDLLMIGAASLAIPKLRSAFMFPTLTEAKKILRDPIDQFWTGTMLPEHMRPQYRASDKEYLWPKEGVTEMLFTDGTGKRNQKGRDFGVVAGDEVGSCNSDAFEHIYASGIMPRLKEGAKVLLTSSPAPSMDHCWVTRFVPDAQLRGTYFRVTSFDNPYRTQRQIYTSISETVGFAMEELPPTKEELYGWLHDRRDKDPRCTAVLREYFAENLPDANQVVFPEFREDRNVGEVQRPPCWEGHTRYTVIDVGYEDFTAIICGYYHWTRGCWVVEDEVILHRATTDQIAEGIRALEARAWGEAAHETLRFSDIDKRLIADLGAIYDIGVSPVQKAQTKQAMIAPVRDSLREGRMIINPRCTHTRAHMQNAMWDSRRKGFARAQGRGHYDAADAVIYFQLMADTTRAPVPPEYGRDPSAFYPIAASRDPNVQALRDSLMQTGRRHGLR
jgi:hypothetical protein